MFGRTARSHNEDDGRRYRSRLDEVLAMAKARALFWDRTSVSTFLSMLAVVGLIVGCQGLIMFNGGQQNISVLDRMAPLGTWSYTLTSIGLMGFGINLLLPLPLYWTVGELKTLYATLGFLSLNLVVFFYGYFLGFITVV